jgi:hypothetical protein
MNNPCGGLFDERPATEKGRWGLFACLPGLHPLNGSVPTFSPQKRNAAESRRPENGAKQSESRSMKSSGFGKSYSAFNPNW